MIRLPAGKNWLFRLTALALLCSLLNFGGSFSVPEARAESMAFQPERFSFTWQYELDFKAASYPGARLQAQAVASNLVNQGVASGLQAAGGDGFRLQMSGSQGVEQLRQVLFASVLAGFLGDPAEIEMQLPASGGHDFSLLLESNPSTGYGWELLSAGTSGFAQSGQSTYSTRSAGDGVPGFETFTFRPSGSESGTIKMAYRRPFGPAEAATRHVRIVSSQALAVIDLTNPHPKVFIPPTPAASANPAVAQPPKASLPETLDWRSAGIVPPVRNQGGCGSCWAFGTVGIMESAIAKIHGPQVDLSEQFLVSCNTYGWNCEDGGLTAHMWHYDAFAKNQTSIGAVLEADKPYTATDGACAEPYAHPFSLSGWEFIVPYEWEMPTVDQIKSAIAAYGPVTAGVCAGRAFQNYTGGVFSTNESCGGWTNHQIILVGWKDTGPAQGYWILRNSWGPWWGESGYMRIAYNTSRVGEGTSWVMWGNRYYFPWVSR